MNRLHVGMLMAVLALVPVTAMANEQIEEHSPDHEFHPNVIAVFGGVTSEDRRDRAFTFGVEYERRLTRSFGMGVIAERAFGDLDFWVFALPLAFHHGPWRLFAAPGVEDSDHLGSEFLFRVGVEYIIDMDGYEIVPQFDIDFVDGEQVFVLGISIARGF
ncbi:MAG: hypothetical protein QNM00_11710 [Gammaproteobacteria bacterium]|nr:hypothetical protein [Gammaproteobacteria bacterium]